MYLRISLILAMVAAPLAAADMTADSETVTPHRLTGQNLLIWCSSSSLTHTGRRRNRYCHGFVSGVEEGIRAMESAQSDNPKTLFRVPPGTTSRQLAKAYVDYATKNTARLYRPAAEVVLEALKNTFPC